MTNDNTNLPLEPLRPDYQRFLSPLRRTPVAFAIFSIVLLVVSFVVASAATSVQGVDALVTIEPRPEKSALELRTALLSAGIENSGAASTMPAVGDIVAFFEAPGLEDRLALANDVTLITTLVDTRAQVLLSAGTVEGADRAVEVLRNGYLRQRGAQVEQDLAALSSGIATQLDVVKRQLDTANGKTSDPTVVGALAIRQVALETLVAAIDSYSADESGIEFVLAKPPKAPSSSRAAPLLLGLVIAGLGLTAALGLLYIFDDRVISRRDLFRAAPGTELIGIIQDGTRTGVVAMARGLEGRLSLDGAPTIQVHATSRPIGDLSIELAAQLADVMPRPAVLSIELDDEEEGLRLASRSLDVVVVDWGKTRRTKLSSTISQLRFAGADAPTLVLRSVPKKELRATL